MSMFGMLIAALMVVGSILVGDGKNDDISKKLIGTWQLTRGVVGGNALPAEAVKSIRLELTDGRYRLTGAESPDEGTWTLHPDEKPLGMDVKGTNGPNKGKTFLSIFELDGDRMKICYDLSGRTRPTRFESKEKTLLFLAEYEWVKQ